MLKDLGLLIAQVRQFRAIIRVEAQNSSSRAQESSEDEKDAARERESPQTWQPNDPRNPQNFSSRRKWTYTIIVCLTNFITSYVPAHSIVCNQLIIHDQEEPPPSTAKWCPKP